MCEKKRGGERGIAAPISLPLLLSFSHFLTLMKGRRIERGKGYRGGEGGKERKEGEKGKSKKGRCIGAPPMPLSPLLYKAKVKKTRREERGKKTSRRCDASPLGGKGEEGAA